MKKTCVCASFLFAMCVAYGEEARPAWQSLVGTDVIIPVGTTNVAEAADMEYLNQVKSLTVNGALVLNATTSWINLNFGGSGMVIKRGATAVSQTVTASSFSGTVRLEGGSLERTTWYVANGTRGKVVVKNGATFISNDAHPSGGLRLELEGAGYQSQGALWLKKTGWGQGVGDITLAGDARITVDANSSGSEYAFAWYTGGTDAIGNTDGRIVMNGHALTIGGTAANIGFNHMTFSGGGSLTFEAPESGTRTVTLASATTLGDLASVTFPADATLVLDGNEIVAQTAPVTALGNLTLTTAGTVGLDTWAGDITLTSSSALTLSAATAGTVLAIDGVIRECGDVKVSSTNAGEVRLGSSANAFAGDLTVDNSKGGSIVLEKAGALPSTAEVAVSGGHIDLGCDPGSGWTAAAIEEFRSRTTFSNGAFLVWDASGCAEPPVEPIDALIDPQGIGAKGTVKLGNITAADNETLYWRTGTAVLTGPFSLTLASFNLYDGNCAFGAEYQPATLELDGGVEVVFGETPVRVGCLGVEQALLPETARLVVKDAVVRNGDLAIQEFAHGYERALVVGGDDAKRVAGVLDVREGAVISNKILAAGWGASAGGGTGRGLIIQRGGTVCSVGGVSASNKNIYFGPGLGMGSGNAHYDLKGGSFTALGSFPFGGYGIGTWTQSGGASVFTNYPGTTSTYPSAFGIGACNRGGGWVDISGGTMDVFGQFNVGCGGLGSKGLLVVRGATAILDCHGNEIKANSGADEARAAIVVSNGGRIRASQIGQGRTATWCSVSFDGGTFVCGAKNKNVFTGTVPLNAVWVRAGGMTVDTDGNTGCSSSVPLTAPQGAGVTSIPLNAPLATYLYSVPPLVWVTGGTTGNGAAALPVFDVETGGTTGFEIVDPGAGFDSATASIYVNSSKNDGAITTLPCTVDASANAVSGDFPKIGAGDFTLNAANTWGGKTRVLGGTLKAGVAGAIPEGADVVLGGGGCLDFNGLEGSVASVTYAVGGGSFANATNVTLPSTNTYEITTTELVAGKTIVLTGDIDLSKVTVRITGDPSLLVESKLYVIATTTGDFSGEATLEADLVLAQWHLLCDDGKLKFSMPRGLMMIFR